MTDLLSLSRAARLAGVTRAEIQKRIRHGEMQTFEGQVAIHDLLRVYPSVSLEQSGDFERVEQIKAEAYPRSHDEDTRLPSQQVLITRIKALAEALVQRVARVEALEQLLEEVRARLDDMAADAGDKSSAGDAAETHTQAQAQARPSLARPQRLVANAPHGPGRERRRDGTDPTACERQLSAHHVSQREDDPIRARVLRRR